MPTTSINSTNRHSDKCHGREHEKVPRGVGAFVFLSIVAHAHGPHVTNSVGGGGRRAGARTREVGTVMGMSGNADDSEKRPVTGENAIERAEREQAEAWAELDAVRADNERLHGLVGELLPFMVRDSLDGSAMPERSGSDPCEPDCLDCGWRERSVGWQERIAAGEFADWGLPAGPHAGSRRVDDEAHVQSAAVAASPHEQDDQAFVDALGAGGTSAEPRKVSRILWNRRPADGGWGGDIDEIVCHDATVHIEQMDDSCWWVGVYGNGGQRWSGNFTVDDGKLRFSQQDSEWAWDLDQYHDRKA